MNELFMFQNIDGVELMVAPGDFIEFVKESGYDGSIELEELMVVLDDWIEE